MLCAAAVTLVLAGCSASSSGGAPAVRPAAASLTSSGGRTASPGAQGGTAGANGVRTVVDGLDAPWDVAFLPSGDALISERDSGRILRLPRGGDRPSVLVTLPGVVHRGESGLLGLAVSPTFASDRYVYAYYTTATDNRIVRFRLTGASASSAASTVTASAPTPILTGLADGVVHNGGRIRFGPDGMLYAGVGDTGNRGLAQNRERLNGKILRMRPDGSVPADNPFPGSLVYSLGHRNVQGLAWDAQGRLWASEFGQDRFDEINLITPGANYGWPVVEGTGDTDGGRFRNPLVTWTTAEASPSGIAIRGSTLHVAALKGQRLWEVTLAGAGVQGQPRAVLSGSATAGRLRAAVNAPDGTVWIVTNNTDGRGQPRPGDDRILSLPAAPSR
ncbi:aldose sugar dehydrogenase [Frankia sp. AiPs1]